MVVAAQGLPLLQFDWRALDAAEGRLIIDQVS
jgi:hypothetical protein